MSCEKTVRDILRPETRARMHRCDSLAALGCAFAAAILLFGFVPFFDNNMLHFRFYLAMTGSVVFALSLYRKSDLNPLEWIPTNAMRLCLIYALIGATAAIGRQS